MKKLKIFLLLSILLCFGFMLSSEVHAQGNGPKAFEVGDVLPATTQLRISWVGDILIIVNGNSIRSNISLIEIPFSNNNIYIGRNIDGLNIVICNTGTDEFTPPYTNYDGDHPYIDIDTSIWDIERRTITQVSSDMVGIFTWEAIGDDIPQDNNPKIFEVGDVLPAGIVRLYWDENTWYKMPSFLNYHQIKSNNNNFNFIERIDNNYYICGINIAIVPEPGDFEFVPPYTVYGEGHSYVDVNTTGWSTLERTISYVLWYETDTFNSKLYWEDITPDGYTQGYLEAREEFGYYDSRTNEWLSVEEYLELYGTDKPGSSDFYVNFDKYFIPAMIIVFGGAIVLTILKVFKGRE